MKLLASAIILLGLSTMMLSIAQIANQKRISILARALELQSLFNTQILTIINPTHEETEKE